jgi:glycerol kinase
VAEGIAASVALLAEAAAGAPGLTSLRADGGLSRSRLVMQAQADLLQRPVRVCRSPDATALGVAALARLGTGEAADVGEALGPAQAETVIEPSVSADEAAERMAAFRSAVSFAAAGR